MILKNWLIYVITIISLAVFSVLYLKHSGFVVLTMAVVVPLVYSIVSFVFARRKIQISFEKEQLSVVKSQKVEIPILLESDSEMNRGSLAVLHIKVRNGLGRDFYTIRRKLYLTSERESVLLEFVPEYSGMNEVRIEKVQIYNSFSLFRPTMRVRTGITFLVMPEYREFPIEIKTIYEENEGESERFSMTKPGGDPSELYDIREYRPGDRVNRIHWKFSAKNNTLMVQDYGFPIACDTAIFVDISGEKDAARIEKAMEILYFLSVKFTLAKKLFYVIWKNFQEEEVKRKIISEQEDIYDLFVELFRSGMAKCEQPIEDIYDVQYEGEFLSGGIFLYAGRNEVEQEIVRTKVRTDYLEFVHV